MKEMIYSPNNGVRLVLHTQTKDGYHIGIMSYGTHPCAYVSIPKDHPYYQKHYDDIDINCHGGLTFYCPASYIVRGEEKICMEWAEGIEEECSWIGWDYAHYDDYAGYYEMMPSLMFGGKKWTTQEILAECYDVIEQLKAVANRIQDVEVVE